MTKTCTRCGFHGPLDRFPICEQTPKGPRYRAICKTCRNTSDRRPRVPRAKATPVDREKRPLVEVTPEFSRYANLRFTNFASKFEFCGYTGLDWKTVDKILYGSGLVELDSVDRVLVCFKDPHLLRDFYPEFYDFTEEQEAEALEILNRVPLEKFECAA